jgi:hypothetical protein
LATVTHLFLRAYAELHAAELAPLVAELERRLAPDATAVTVRTPGPYWKIPSCQELFLEFDWPAGEESAVAEVASRLGRGWHQPNELSAVWNRAPRATLCDPRVLWAEVALAER